MHTLPKEKHDMYLSQVESIHREKLEELLLFLRNMSCVGQLHPDWPQHSHKLADMFGIKVELDVHAEMLSYATLVNKLRFRGVDVLLVDAEGHDVEIIRSMIAHCQEAEEADSWPKVIQIETMGHVDLKSRSE